MITAPVLYDVIDGTWPAAQFIACGPVTVREGIGGGSRVSAATVNGPFEISDILQAEAAMQGLGQPRLFMIRDGDEKLDAVLQDRGYEIRDPVTMYAGSVADLTRIPMPRVTVFPVWEPLAIMSEIWAEAGIGPARVAVMARVKGPKTGLLARHNDKPAGVAFVAIHEQFAMVHAVEILPHQRRKGVGAWVMRGAAFWAADKGAHSLTVICTQANNAANFLYTSLGMQVVGQYYYRILPKEKNPT